jgi:transcriptional regulator NrdR family protein
MNCPYCGSEGSKVTGHCYKSQSRNGKNENRRYRKCLTCGAIFITVERLVDPRIEKEYENERKDSIIDR